MVNLHQVLNRPWAVTAEIAGHARQLFELEGFAGLRRLAQLRVDAGIVAAPTRAVGRRAGQNVAVISILGMITLRGDVVDCAATESALGIGDQVGAAAADESVSAIVMEFDSPGGQVDGIPEAAARIREARAVKPVVAIANTVAGSAAYWLASAADELLVTTSGHVGSIGVYYMHEDRSKATDAEGRKVSLVSAGKYKTEGNPFEPLSDEARTSIQTEVDRIYEMFVKDVARGRGVSVDDVRGGYGQGRMVGGKAAVEQGMANAVGTMDDAIRRAASLATERKRASGSSARAQAAQIRRARG